MRGTWLRIEMDKEKKIWAQMKKGPKIPIFCFLLAMGVSEKRILKTIKDSYKLLGNINNSIKNPPEAWKEISKLMNSRKSSGRGSTAAQPWGAAKLVGAEPPKPLGEALRGALLP
jgi:DNA-directed RNA polymerase beta subunit